jgi:hypothetical protein
MSIKERFQGIFSKKNQSASVETRKGVSVHFQDIREEEAAKEKGVDPGYYFVIHPISPQNLKDTRIINNFTPSFFKILIEKGLLKGTLQEIGESNDTDLIVDTANAWQFTPVGYIAEKQMLIVGAKPVNQEAAEKHLIETMVTHPD